MGDSAALSALDWWQEAGVDTLVDDAPRNWLAEPIVTMSDAGTPPAPVPATAPTTALPATLAAFRAFLLKDAPLAGGSAARIDAAGDPQSGIVVVVDMPEADDRASGALLTGEIGALFDRMLAAIKLDRAGIYLIPFSPLRPATERLRPDDCDALTPLLWHHLALVAPHKLLLLGDAPVQALLGQPAAKARDAVHQVTVGGAAIPTVASLHPRLVHQRRECRPLMWADLQRFEAL